MKPLILDQGTIKQASDGELDPSVLDYSKAPEKFRSMIISNEVPSDDQGEDGDIWHQVD